MQAVKRAVAKLQGDKTASFSGEMSGREKMQGDKSAYLSSMELYPWNFMTHGFLDLSAFPVFKTNVFSRRSSPRASVKCRV